MIRKVANIGGTKTLECDINYPTDHSLDHIMSWRKHGAEVPIFIQFNGYPPHVDEGYQGRIRLVEQATVELSDIRINDEGTYECSVVFPDGLEGRNINGSWIYLAVNGMFAHHHHYLRTGGINYYTLWRKLCQPGENIFCHTGGMNFRGNFPQCDVHVILILIYDWL